MKMLKLLRVMKIKRLLMKFEEYIVSDQMNLIVTFLNITVLICFTAHYIGCFFFYFGMEEYRNDKESGWLPPEDLIKENFGTRYVTSVYWAFTTMAAVGYGEIRPRTEVERTYGMAVIIFSSFIFAYCVNSIGSIISNYNRIATMYRERMLYVN